MGRIVDEPSSPLAASRSLKMTMKLGQKGGYVIVSDGTKMNLLDTPARH